MRSWLLWASGTLAGAALVSAAACGGGDTTAAGGAGGSGGGSGGGHNSGGATSSTTGSTGGAGGMGTGGSGQGGGGGMFVPMCEATPNDTIFAMDNLVFGANNAQAWKTIGFDLDQHDSMNDCSQQCTINSHGSAAKECTDGTNGIDNTFGEVIVPFLNANTVNIDDQANMAIQMGEFTIMLDLAGLTPGADQGPLVMKLYNGGSLQGTPKFDGSDCWPVTPESLKNKTDISSAKASFTMTRITANHVVSGTIDTLQLSFSTNIGPISINVRAARLEFDLNGNHDGVMQGFVGGVIDEAEFLDTIQGAIYTRFGPTLGKTLCHMGDTTIEGAVDIMDDGSAGIGSTCNGISFGVGFTAKLVQFGGIGPATPPTTNMCPAM